MNNTKIFVFISCIFIASSVLAQKSKKCYTLLDEKKYSQAISCLRAQDDNLAVDVLYGLAEAYVSLRSKPSDLDSAFAIISRAKPLYDSLDVKLRQKLKDKLGISKVSFKKIKNRSSFFAYKFINDTIIEELSAFIERFPETPTIVEAEQKIEELELFRSLPEDKPIDFYWKVIEKYPDNPKINDIWQIYYKLYTFDGELLTLEKFTINYPQYPYPNQIDRDRNTAQMAERHKLDLKYTASLAHIYDAYISLAAPRLRANKVLRMYISPYVQSKQFTRAADTVRKYAEKFEGSTEYANLLRVLTIKEQAPVKKPLPGLINTPGFEFSPVLTKNDKVLYFCGKDRDGNIGGEDIFITEYQDSVWSKPTVIPGINTVLGHEAPEALSADGTRMLLFQNGDIYYSDKYLDKKGNLRWTDPIRYKELNTAGWEGDASLTADGKAILFASEAGQRANKQFIARDRKDLFDIFVSVKDGNKWGRPINLGPIINSTSCDRYPFLHPDMKTLYFSSEGHGSLGGLDVYVSHRLNDSSWTEWSEPVNLGRYINTVNNDTGYKISSDGDRAFFSAFGSQRYDLYTVTIPEDKRPQKVAVISGRVMNVDSVGIQANLLVEDLETGAIVGEYRSDVQDGSFTMLLPLGKNYGYFVSQWGYFPSSDNVDLRAEKKMVEVSREFVLHKVDTLIKYEQSIELKNIFFASDDYALKPESHSELSRIATLIKAHKIRMIQVEGHTDSTGTKEHNLSLSKKRAQAIVSYLIKQGVSAETIQGVGYGSSAPVDSNSTNRGRANNRRVEIRFKGDVSSQIKK